MPTTQLTDKPIAPPLVKPPCRSFYCNDHLNIEIQGEAQRRIVRHEKPFVGSEALRGIEDLHRFAGNR